MIEVEVVFATLERQVLTSIEVVPGATIIDAVRRSGIAADFPGFDLEKLPKGIWGARKADDQVLSDGDRIEIYRPLVTDPMEARRRRAEKAD